jgi:DNA-binding NarL/FixJ family response regulator
MTETKSAAETIRILIVDDHNVVRQGLHALLSTVDGFDVVAQASSQQDAVQMYKQHRPDITLMDLRLQSGSGVEAIQELRRLDAGARIIVLTTYDGDEDIFKSLQAGAKSYLLKGSSSEELIEAIRKVHAGKQYIPHAVAARLAVRMGAEELTGREMDVLQQIVLGKSNKEIAQQLGISEATVKSHINNLLGKLMVEDRTQAAITAIQRGLVRV